MGFIACLWEEYEFPQFPLYLYQEKIKNINNVNLKKNRNSYTKYKKQKFTHRDMPNLVSDDTFLVKDRNGSIISYILILNS
ncbi:unnamed protein product, partial [Vitis vinifera]|uniref:Uncharacterized protein n=1 Tax=Vitis vinifera TaxID=29760 RepID=D7T148_VITVI